MTGSALGSKGKAVDMVLSGTHENTGCEIWGMAAGTGNHRVIGGHLQSTYLRLGSSRKYLQRK